MKEHTEHFELSALALGEFLDLVVLLELLVAEVAAGECQDLETGRVLGVQFLIS
jgi:hypothetical protein